MKIARNVAHIDRTRWSLGHNNSVWIQGAFPELDAAGIAQGAYAYGPCWAAVDPGMTLDPHSHDTREMYVFVAGEGKMLLGDDWFDVRAGMAVNIPSDTVHSVANDASATGPIVWLSLGFRP